jgi:malonate-semialdehyde dehydrogenase (acetylating)/methylmalonate-semialdehyde dehydrogenase
MESTLVAAPGRGSIEFWTKAKKTTTKWNREAGANWMS